MLNLPNILTLIRIGLILPFVVIFYVGLPYPTASYIAAGIFAVAAVTDFFDGKLARRSDQVTTLGKFLDPIADKLLVCAAFVLLTGHGYVPAWITIVILSREFIISGLRSVAAADNIIISAGQLGKIKAFLQMVAIVVLLADPNRVLSFGSVSVGDVILWIATAMTVWSGVDYMARNWHAVTGKKKGANTK